MEYFFTGYIYSRRGNIRAIFSKVTFFQMVISQQQSMILQAVFFVRFSVYVSNSILTFSYLH
jgi:hypothetical protein